VPGSSLSFSPVGDNLREDIHSVAEKFLRDHLSKTGSKCEIVRPVAPRAACAVESRSAAEGFLRQHLAARQTQAKRYEIEEPQQVILARRSSNVTSYFYGWKAQRPLFVHAQHLALNGGPCDIGGAGPLAQGNRCRSYSFARARDATRELVNRRHFGVGIEVESTRPKTYLAKIVSPSGPRSALVSSHDEALEWLRENFGPGDDSIEIHDIVRWPFLREERPKKLQSTDTGIRSP
jgi:hypothetical protein